MTHQPSSTTGTGGRLRRFSRRLCSRRFVVIQLVLFLAVCVAGVLIPQQSSASYAQWASAHPIPARLAGWTGLDEAFTSPLLLFIVTFLGLNLTLFVLTRLGDLVAGGTGQGWGRLLFARRRLLGSLIFHAGLVGILIAATITALTRSEGNIILTEGQDLEIDAARLQNLAAPRLKPKNWRPFRIRHNEFHPVHQGRFGTPDYASDLTVIENGEPVHRATVRVNEPLRHRGVTVYYRIHGYAPLFVLSDAAGRQRFVSWVTLSTELEADPVRYIDDFAIPGTRLSVEAEFFPDAYLDGDRLASRSPDAKNPAVSVTVKDGKNIVYSGPIFLGKPADLGGGFRLGIEDVRYWAGLNAVRDKGAGALFLSSWVAIAGLCVRYLPQRRKALADA